LFTAGDRTKWIAIWFPRINTFLERGHLGGVSLGNVKVFPFQATGPPNTKP